MTYLVLVHFNNVRVPNVAGIADSEEEAIEMVKTLEGDYPHHAWHDYVKAPEGRKFVVGIQFDPQEKGTKP